MKKLIFTLCAMMIAMASYAQDIQTAVLQSGAKFTTYTGASALVQACENAKENDIIMLSKGDFNAPTTISVAGLQIRGAAGLEESSGYWGAESKSLKSSIVLEEDMTINSDNVRITCCNIKNTYDNDLWPKSTVFEKCKIAYVYANQRYKDSYFINCDISNLYLASCSAYVYFINSKIYTQENSWDGYYIMKNCYINVYNNNGGDYTWSGESYFYNSVFHFYKRYTANENFELKEGNAHASYCVSTGDYSVWGNLIDPTNKHIGSGDYSSYKGDDGTQVGPEGGEYPFTLEGSYPHIESKTISVDRENNKLKINVKVSTNVQ